MLLKWFDDFLAVLRYGRGVKLTWAKAPGWSGGRVEQLLRRYGVRVYGRQYAHKDGDEYGLIVSEQQARWAERVLRRAGCPLTGELVDESNRNVMPGPVRAWSDTNPKATRKPVGLAGRVIDFLTRV